MSSLNDRINKRIRFFNRNDYESKIMSKNVNSFTYNKVIVDKNIKKGSGGSKNIVSTIEEALNLVDNNGIIIINEGIYSGKGNINLDIEKNVTIIGINKENTIIDAKKLGFIFCVKRGKRVVLNNFKIKNGIGNINKKHTKGGAIYVEGGILRIAGVDFINNFSMFDGGALYNKGGLVKISKCKFLNNLVENSNGGVLYNNNGTLNVTSSCFEGNESKYGVAGAFYIEGGKSTIISSEFINNKSLSRAGAIANKGELMIIGCSFENNQSKHGGAIANGGILDIRSSCFVNNHSIMNSQVLFNVGGSIRSLDYNWWADNNPNWSELIGSDIFSPKYWIILDFSNTTPIADNKFVDWTVKLDEVCDSNGHIDDIFTNVKLLDRKVKYTFNDTDVINDTVVEGYNTTQVKFDKNFSSAEAEVDGVTIRLVFK